MIDQRLREGGWIGGGGDQVDVVTGLGSPSGRARDLNRLDVGIGPEVGRELLGYRQHLRQDQPLRRSQVGELAERRKHVLLDLWAQPLEIADALLLGRPSQVV